MSYSYELTTPAGVIKLKTRDKFPSLKNDHPKQQWIVVEFVPAGMYIGNTIEFVCEQRRKNGWKLEIVDGAPNQCRTGPY